VVRFGGGKEVADAGWPESAIAELNQLSRICFVSLLLSRRTAGYVSGGARQKPKSQSRRKNRSRVLRQKRSAEMNPASRRLR
jgi:hypothetical protein